MLGVLFVVPLSPARLLIVCGRGEPERYVLICVGTFKKSYVLKNFWPLSKANPP